MTIGEGGEARNHETEVEAVIPTRAVDAALHTFATYRDQGGEFGSMQHALAAALPFLSPALDAVRCAQGRDTGTHEALGPLSAEDDERHARWEFERSRLQRKSIAWCGECGNISVDGINFARVGGGLQCAGCGAISPHFEYIRRSPQRTAGRGDEMSETSEKLDHTLRAYGRLERKHGERGRELTAVEAERDVYKAALQRILDHGQTHDEPCWALHNGDCADVMQEIARSVLAGVVSTREKDK